jgi:hypothetical protein
VNRNVAFGRQLGLQAQGGNDARYEVGNGVSLIWVRALEAGMNISKDKPLGFIEVRTGGEIQKCWIPATDAKVCAILGATGAGGYYRIEGGVFGGLEATYDINQDMRASARAGVEAAAGTDSQGVYNFAQGGAGLALEF